MCYATFFASGAKECARVFRGHVFVAVTCLSRVGRFVSGKVGRAASSATRIDAISRVVSAGRSADLLMADKDLI